MSSLDIQEFSWNLHAFEFSQKRMSKKNAYGYLNRIQKKQAGTFLKIELCTHLDSFWIWLWNILWSHWSFQHISVLDWPRMIFSSIQRSLDWLRPLKRLLGSLYKILLVQFTHLKSKTFGFNSGGQQCDDQIAILCSQADRSTVLWFVHWSAIRQNGNQMFLTLVDLV